MMNDAKGGKVDTMKVKRSPMTKAERVRSRAEREEQKIRRWKELADEPPSRLDRLLEALGHPPTLEQRLKEVLKSSLKAYLKIRQVMKDKYGDVGQMGARPSTSGIETNHEKGETKDGQ
jgi:hypothetical protein